VRESVEAFEREAGTPEEVARNLVSLAKHAGARYLTLTLLHTCGRLMVLFPTRLPGFRLRTQGDYAGAVLREGARQGIKIIFYMPGGVGEHWNAGGGPWLDPEYAPNEAFSRLLCELVDELADAHGNLVGGFWIDGYNPQICGLPAHIHRRLPEAIVIANNDSIWEVPEADYSASEFTSGPCDPPYNRPSGLRAPHPKFRIMPPRRDFVEDIPTCNNWWQGAPEDPEVTVNPYIADPAFVVRQMISSVAQRGRWNFALGLGPDIQGNAPREFTPMLNTLHQFLARYGEAIYDTIGGEGAPVQQGWWGWWHDQAFGSLTLSAREKNTGYLFVTTPPTSGQLCAPLNGVTVREVTLLPEGQPVPFTSEAVLTIEHKDWSRAREEGATVFRLRW